MCFDLAVFEPHIAAEADAWESLGLTWTVAPIHPNHGKAVTSATFEGARWLAQILVWATGETEVETMRRSDGQIINKHYDLAATDDLRSVVDEVLGLLRDGEIPEGAFVP